jgi:hypothetical protein
MRLPRMRGLLVIMPAVAVVAGLALPAQAASPRSTDPTEFTGRLNAVSADSPDDAWAVGQVPTGEDSFSLITLHWDGTAWTQVANPEPGWTDENRDLYGVSAVGPDDAWAVGYYQVAGGVTRPLILHWDGTSWAKEPISGPHVGQLTAVTADSPTDAWAVGDGAGGRLLILHWDGTTWTHGPSLNPAGTGGTSVLDAVSAGSPADAWATGLTYSNDPTDRHEVSLALHWNGTSWSRVPIPTPGPTNDGYYGVTAISPTDAWAVGETTYASPATVDTVAVHWNGTSWAKVTTTDGPAGNAHISTLSAVSGDGPDDVWAVGAYEGPGTRSLVLHWTGTGWGLVSSPSPSPTGAAVNIFGVSADSPADAWAVGISRSRETMLMHWNGTSWTEW